MVQSSSSPENHARLLELGAAQHQHGSVAPSSKDMFAGSSGRVSIARRPTSTLSSVSPLPGEDRHAERLLGGAAWADDACRGGVVLGGRCCSWPSGLRHQGRPASPMAPRSATVMCSEPEIRAPLSGSTSAYSRRSAPSDRAFRVQRAGSPAAEFRPATGRLPEVDSIAGVGGQIHGHHVPALIRRPRPGAVPLGERYVISRARSAATSWSAPAASRRNSGQPHDRDASTPESSGRRGPAVGEGLRHSRQTASDSRSAVGGDDLVGPAWPRRGATDDQGRRPIRRRTRGNRPGERAVGASPVCSSMAVSCGRRAGRPAATHCPWAGRRPNSL